MMEVERKQLIFNKDKSMYIKEIFLALLFISLGILGLYCYFHFDFNYDYNGRYEAIIIGFITWFIAGIVPQLVSRAKFKEKNKFVIKYFNINKELSEFLFMEAVIFIVVVTFKFRSIILFGISMIIGGVLIAVEDFITYIKRIPLFIIDDSGIDIKIFSKKVKIQWREIKSIFTYNESFVEKLAIELYDMEGFKRKLNILEKLSMGGHKVVVFYPGKLPIKTNDLYNILVDRLKESKD